MSTLDWCGDSGPLLLVGAVAVRQWLGCWREPTTRDDDLPRERRGNRWLVLDDDFGPHEPGTDYTRALSSFGRESCGVVPFDGGEALVLSTEGHQAALLRAKDGLVVAKWLSAPSAEHAERALSKLPVLPWKPTKVRWRHAGRSVVLHPAAERYEAAAPSMQLRPGQYRVATCSWAFDEQTNFELWLVQFSADAR